MSLRAFHLFFIATSVVLSLGVGVWGLRTWMAGAGGGRLTLAVVFLVAAFVLIVYGLRVRRKLEELREEDE
jgi:hypothetical protein